MKYTAIAVALMGVLIASVAGFQYATRADLSSATVDPSPPMTLLLMGFGITAILAGAMMWMYGGRGYALSWLRFDRRPVNTANQAHTHTSPVTHK